MKWARHETVYSRSYTQWFCKAIYRFNTFNIRDYILTVQVVLMETQKCIQRWHAAMPAEQDLCYKGRNLAKKMTSSKQLLKCGKLSIIVAWIRKWISATCEHNGVAHTHITCHVHEFFKWWQGRMEAPDEWFVECSKSWASTLHIYTLEHKGTNCLTNHC